MPVCSSLPEIPSQMPILRHIGASISKVASEKEPKIICCPVCRGDFVLL
jgi:hypothetical protein